jgi:uncharacterized membrane protein (DUF106 family)
MVFLKLLVVVSASACTLVLFTVVWVLAQNRGADGIDVDLLPTITLHSPLYWLLVSAILTTAGWLCRRWMFPG